MIEFSRAQLTHIVAHWVGNKGLGEELSTSQSLIEFSDDFVKDTTLRYFLSPFKTDIYYRFKGKIDISLNSVANICEDLFKSRHDFLKKSKDMATILYDQGMHPKIRGGGFYVCYFQDVICDGELVDAIGLFKNEKQETFLKLLQHGPGTDQLVEFELECDAGIDINKLDKGCLIFNTQKVDGYKLSVIDSNNKVAECCLYWLEDFLNAKIQPNDYYHTKNFYDAGRVFLEESNIVQAMPEVSRIGLKNKLMTYLSEVEKFDKLKFELEVLADKSLIADFNEVREDFHKRMDLPSPVDEFEISSTAVKQNKKYTREIIKLDRNFHLYIHSNTQFLEKGFDEEKGMKFYKMFYVNEE